MIRSPGQVYDTYKYPICKGTLVNFVKDADASKVLDDFEEAAALDLEESPRANSCETSIKVNGKNHWAHILISLGFVSFFLHPKRGQEAFDAWGMLRRFTGVLVHDCFAPYFKYDNCKHALCNAHIIRELQAAVDVGQSWAEDMIEFLLDLLELKYWYGGLLPLQLQCQARERFGELLAVAYESTGGRVLARPPGQEGKRGRIPKASYRNLLERMDLRQDALLRFIEDPNVPFTNNDAERPVRSLKVRLKVSGCFR
jgi:transposase